jgi:hypothetical protein
MMSAKSWRLLILIPWGWLPFFIYSFWRARAGLPARLAVHFNFKGEADGWMSPVQFFAFGIFLLLTLLVVFSTVLTPSGHAPKSFIILLSFYVSVTGGAMLLWQVLQYNQHGTPIRWSWIGAAVLMAAVIPLVATWVGGGQSKPPLP